MTGARLAYRVPEAAEQLGLSERQMWRLIATRAVTAIRAGRATLVPASSLSDWIARQLENESATGYQPVTLDEAVSTTDLRSKGSRRTRG